MVVMTDEPGLERAVTACRQLIETRFPQGGDAGAAAMLLADGTVLTGTSPPPLNPSVTVCHEIEPYCAAHRLDLAVVASVCLHRAEDGRFLVLSPCGVCRERLAAHGPDVRVAVAADHDPTQVRWVTLREVLPHYWLRAFPEDIPAWQEPAAPGP